MFHRLFFFKKQGSRSLSLILHKHIHKYTQNTHPYIYHFSTDYGNYKMAVFWHAYCEQRSFKLFREAKHTYIIQRNSKIRCLIKCYKKSCKNQQCLRLDFILRQTWVQIFSRFLIYHYKSFNSLINNARNLGDTKWNIAFKQEELLHVADRKIYGVISFRLL